MKPGFVKRLIESKIDDKEKISLIEDVILELEHQLIAYKLRDKQLIEELKKEIKPHEYIK